MFNAVKFSKGNTENPFMKSPSKVKKISPLLLVNPIEFAQNRSKLNTDENIPLYLKRWKCSGLYFLNIFTIFIISLKNLVPKTL